ncbi:MULTISPECIES: HD domain-containing protein [Allobacillus]|uniref:HD domain-containing protein n=1 Tax=Allobacillus salarius TaxID=1955272 RepID=A0A556PLR9_9BACI|nr:HD domain-containing protein [Allobacillus salarius]TSJ65335.1 HD domain-containing protein [Allobacillus salarius]
MGYVTLVEIFKHPITQKYLRRSGVHHAVNVTEIAYRLASERKENPELATKAALLHDMGHFEWYREGKWDYDEYRRHDIHAIKGAERAHKLLIRLGENRVKAKEIAIAILLHTDSYLPFSVKEFRTPLQQIIYEADEMDELPKGGHHYLQMENEEAIERLTSIDQKIQEVSDKLQSN